MYEELLPRSLQDPVKLVGKKGCVNIFHSSLLHRATENKTKFKCRRALIMNFGRKSDPFGKRQNDIMKMHP